MMMYLKTSGNFYKVIDARCTLLVNRDRQMISVIITDVLSKFKTVESNKDEFDEVFKLVSEVHLNLFNY